ncbi:hypothetical protein GJ496_007814 [Pomphorhynchus laevis]|nr:hypothetical protein GJ496_007814 [Pomphorhynchus laevis]
MASCVHSLALQIGFRLIHQLSLSASKESTQLCKQQFCRRHFSTSEVILIIIPLLQQASVRESEEASYAVAVTKALYIQLISPVAGMDISPYSNRDATNKPLYICPMLNKTNGSSAQKSIH